MSAIHVVPADGLKVRSEDGDRIIKPTGEWVARSNYYNRALAAGDLLHATDAVVLHRAVNDEMQSLHPDYFTADGEITTRHAAWLLGRPITRKTINEILGE